MGKMQKRSRLKRKVDACFDVAATSNPTRRSAMKVVAGGGLSLAGAVVMPGLLRAKSPIAFGLTPVFLDSDMEIMALLTQYFSERLNHPVQPVKRRTYQEITTMLLSGQLDAAWVCGFPFVQYRERLSLLAVPLYRGRPLYQSYLIVERSRKATDVTDLRGDVHAFSDPNSNSGYLVTRHLLWQMKETPESYFDRTLFTYGHRNVIRAVSSGLANSGSVDGYVWDVMKETEDSLIAGTQVIRKSEFLGFPPIASNAQPRNPAATKALTKALLDMAGDPLGRQILGILRLDGFVERDVSLFDGIAKKYSAIRQDGNG